MQMLVKPENKRNHMQVVDLDMLVPEDHLLRKIDKVLDFDRIYDFAA